jgi:PAS domain S-box-containing protein
MYRTATAARRVLLVEDDEGLRKLIAKTLTTAGYEVQDVANGTEAVESASEDPLMLLLLDHQLPDMMAHDIVRALSERGFTPSFIIMTGRGDERLAVEMMKLGAVDYLVKDIDLMNRLPGILERAFSNIETNRRLQETEEKLLESEKHFRSVVENAEAGYFFIDKEGIIRDVNDSWVKMYKYPSAEEVVGHHFTEIQKVDDIERAKEFVAGIMQGESKFSSGEFSRKCKDGSEGFHTFSANPVIRSGDICGVEGFIIDITERRQADEELQRSKDLLRKVLDTVPNYICAKNLDGRFLLVNKELAEFYGMTVDELTGVLHADICENEEELQAMLDADREVIESGKAKVIPEETMQHPDGSVTYLETIKVPFAIFGNPVVLILARDVTERKELEEERTKGAKLESIGVLAGGIAHDFNNILTTILTNVSLAKMMLDGEGNDEIKDRLTQSELAGRRAAALTQQLLTFSRGGAPVKKTALLGDIVKESTGFSLSGSNVKCRHYIDKDLWPCSVDSGQISQVINNLVINADQAMPEGGVIEIRVKNVVVSSKDILLLEEGKYVRVTVKDHGIGISEQHLSKIFDPYFSTKQKGSGLGLATCYSIVVRHDGHIAVESEQNVGTSFHIYLPATSRRVLKKGKETGKATLPAGRVLVMDDEPSVLEVLVGVLESFGQEAQGAADGAEAVKLYKRAMKSGKPFDAVILDLTVPGGMGGKETIKKLLKIDPGVKAIVSSGYSNDPVIANFKEYGFSGVVSKPYQIEKLQNVLHEVMKKEKNG